MRDDLIVEIARRNPTRERDLQTVRGLPRRDLDAIVETVAAAAKLPAEEWPTAVRARPGSAAGGADGRRADGRARRRVRRLRLAPNLVASNQDVKRLVRARFVGGPLPDDMPLTQGWRAAAILPELLAVLEGRRTLRVADVTAAAPFAYADTEPQP